MVDAGARHADLVARPSRRRGRRASARRHPEQLPLLVVRQGAAVGLLKKGIGCEGACGGRRLAATRCPKDYFGTYFRVVAGLTARGVELDRSENDLDEALLAQVASRAEPHRTSGELCVLTEDLIVLGELRGVLFVLQPSGSLPHVPPRHRGHVQGAERPRWGRQDPQLGNAAFRDGNSHDLHGEHRLAGTTHLPETWHARYDSAPAFNRLKPRRWRGQDKESATDGVGRSAAARSHEGGAEQNGWCQASEDPRAHNVDRHMLHLLRIPPVSSSVSPVFAFQAS